MRNEINEFTVSQECRALALEAFRDWLTQNPGEDPRDGGLDVYYTAHEIADMHEWVIYTHSAIRFCAECDITNGERFLEDGGMPETPTFGGLASTIVYGELRDRVAEELQELIEAWEASEEVGQ